jgi:hypothetical protein
MVGIVVADRLIRPAADGPGRGAAIRYRAINRVIAGHAKEHGVDVSLRSQGRRAGYGTSDNGDLDRSPTLSWPCRLSSRDQSAA